MLLGKNDTHSADALVFNGADLLKNPQKFLGSNGKIVDQQKYVFFSLESPINLNYRALRNLDSTFDWTMTYQIGSDILVPYGRIKPSKGRKIPLVTEKELKRKKIATAMISHCPTYSQREEIIKQMQRYINVDVYGTCGPLACGTRTTIGTLTSKNLTECDAKIKTYSFFLAFENSLCEDYVTEKMYRALQLGVIPVVLGGANYSLFAPPNSVINVADFATIEKLTIVN